MSIKVIDFIERISEFNTVAVIHDGNVLEVYDGKDSLSGEYNDYAVEDFNINRKFIEIYV